jgi:transcription elongation GreA/GreB family factor
MDWKNIKKETIEIGKEIVQDKIVSITRELEALNQSAISDTKSSMGDKYETGREMIQQERNKLGEQLGQLERQKIALGQLDFEKSYSSVSPGALVVTETANFFISTSLGKVEGEVPVFMLSPVAPMAKAMIDLKPGDEFIFNGQASIIREVI